MAIARRECLHHYFLAECGRCGFTVEGEIRNGYGGWKAYDWKAFGESCTHRTPDGKSTMVCPHLRAAKLAAQPLTVGDFHLRLHRTQASQPDQGAGADLARVP
ncbi:MAG TPA: hypothetical protein VMF66_10840 [Candidatus Acidoferrum sp.]|nr:hypothetical protein [Candidatus Acidoferrum sp.]